LPHRFDQNCPLAAQQQNAILSGYPHNCFATNTDNHFCSW
jgi:hypothetical protein